MNQKHPRTNEEELVPLCIPTGNLPYEKTDKIDNFDEHGIGVSIYFKLLKSFMAFMTWCLIINLPLIFIYSQGSVWSIQSGITQQILGRQTLGNLGESSL
jgi:hypothetical protein